jgi:hypothetical protein|tara:strand:+ start:2496 stop:3497 length:1002 start_codon:yes stop_codon:yes gene_type:complete
MAFQKVEFDFPDEEENNKGDIEIESSEAVEIDLSGKKEAKDYKETEDEYEVEVVDDVPKSDRNRKPSSPPNEVTDEELEDYSEKVRNRIKHFSKGYHDERRAKEASQRQSQELESFAKNLVEENNKLKGTVDKNQEALLEQAKRTAAGEMLLAKRSYKQAYEAGDADKLLEAQEKMTAANLKADKLENFAPSSLQTQDNEVQIPQQNVTKQPEIDERAANWAKENSWFGSDKEMTGYAMGLHDKLVTEEGVDPSSDEYYETINSRMQKLFPDNFEGEAEETESKRRSNVVAPATRSTAPKKVRLTQTQVAIAKKLGVPLELYAKKVAEEMRKI